MNTCTTAAAATRSRVRSRGSGSRPAPHPVRAHQPRSWSQAMVADAAASTLRFHPRATAPRNSGPRSSSGPRVSPAPSAPGPASSRAANPQPAQRSCTAPPPPRACQSACARAPAQKPPGAVPLPAPSRPAPPRPSPASDEVVDGALARQLRPALVTQWESPSRCDSEPDGAGVHVYGGRRIDTSPRPCGGGLLLGSPG